MTKIFKNQYHQRSTYESLVRDTILEPKDKIALPDRRATQLRNLQQLNVFDDENFLGLKDEQERIAEQHMQTMEYKKLNGESDDRTHHVEQAFQPKPPPDYQPPPNSQPPPNPPKFDKGTQSRPDTATATVQTGGKPPPPPGAGAIKKSAFTQTPSPQVFDMTIDESMNDDNDEFKKFFDQQEAAKKRKQTNIREQIAQHLGPHSSTADQSYVSRLVEQGPRRAKTTSPSPLPMEVASSSNQPPHFPPGGEAIKVTGVVRNQTKPKHKPGKGKTKKDPMEIDASTGDNKPPPPPPPPPMPIFKAPREKTPMRGRPRASTVKAASSTETGAEIKTRRGRSRSAARGEEEVKIKPAPAPIKIDVTPKRPNTEGLPTEVKKQRAQSEPAKKPRGQAAKPKAMAKPTKPILKSIPEGKYAPEPPEKHRKTLPSPEGKKEGKKHEMEGKKEKTTPIKIKVIKKAELAKVKPTKDFIPPSRVSVKNVVEILKNRMKDLGFSKTDSSSVIDMMKEYTNGASKERKRQIDGEFKKLYSKYYKALRA